MDFSNKNIQEILKYSVPKRFQDMSPTDFEDFIAELFKKFGYQVEQTSYSGDFGADFIATKNNRKIAVQVKRYAKSNKVGVPDINQVIGAKDYYKCDASMIITTSEYTNPALKLLAEANVKYWNWNILQKNISKAYLDGKDIYQFFPDLINNSNKEMLEFKITKIEYNRDMKRIGSCTLIYATVTNSGANTDIALQLPVIITLSNQQVEAIYWYEGYFTSGTVYSGASVDVAFMFRTDQISMVSVGDRIIFNVHQDNEALETFDTTVNIASVEIASFNGCYVTTLCFGKNSREYSELTYFRDNYLIKNNIGRRIIQNYYKYGGILISLLKDILVAKLISKFIIKLITQPISLFNCYLRKNKNLSKSNYRN